MKKTDDLIGKFEPLDESNENTYAWVRNDPTIQQKLLVVLNLARGDGRGAPATFRTSDLDTSGARLLITNGKEAINSKFDGVIELEPWEGRIYLL